MNRFIPAATLLMLAACQKNDAVARDSAAGALSDTTAAATAKTPDSTALANPGQPASGTTGADVSATQAGALLDPNSATKQQLTAIKNITPGLADSIIAHRPYANMLGVNKVLAGLSKPQRDTVYMSLFKPLDLNSASPEEITSIPGIGNRMRHEFEEYRPYKNIEQFRREIGKYVPKEEVARLERYVTIKQ